MRAIEAELLSGSELYREVVLGKLAHARESVFIATANVKDMHVEGRSITALFSALAARGVELRILHAELRSRPFRRSFDRRRSLVSGGLDLKICPRVQRFKSPGAKWPRFYLEAESEHRLFGSTFHFDRRTRRATTTRARAPGNLWHKPHRVARLTGIL